MRTLVSILLLCNGVSFAAPVETDSAGAPLILRETGVLYDEHGLVTEDDGHTPRSCHVEIYSHYFRVSHGRGQTLAGLDNARELLDLNLGSSEQSLTISNHQGAYIAALPMMNKDGVVDGRQLFAGLFFKPEFPAPSALTILTFRGGQISEYESRYLLPDEGPVDVEKLKSAGGRPATLQRQSLAWAHPNYYLYARCAFRSPVS